MKLQQDEEDEGKWIGKFDTGEPTLELGGVGTHVRLNDW
jgi:hypothetical protein